MALAANALTTVARLARELQITAPASGDALAQMEDLISEVSAAVESYCGRRFAKATLTEAVPSYDTAILLLSRSPLLEVSQVTRDGALVPQAEWATTPEPDDAAAGLLRNLTSSWLWSSDFASSAAPERHPGQERRRYTVTYTAGYVLPKDATNDSPRTLPYDLERAVLLTCVAEYRNRGRNLMVSSESLLSASLTYAQPGSSPKATEAGIIPEAAAIILDRYKKWA
jgi:hypothetical protein